MDFPLNPLCYMQVIDNMQHTILCNSIEKIFEPRQSWHSRPFAKLKNHTENQFQNIFVRQNSNTFFNIISFSFLKNGNLPKKTLFEMANNNDIVLPKKINTLAQKFHAQTFQFSFPPLTIVQQCALSYCIHLSNNVCCLFDA